MACTVAPILRGPSPRVRGSPVPADIVPVVPGSIPACAGKPGSLMTGRCPTRVHPRVCGEALNAVRQRGFLSGPSPRVRGSRFFLAYAVPWRGSIPACAGKPPSGHCARARQGVHPACAGKPVSQSVLSRVIAVHPRVCGEAVTSEPCDGLDVGPSPGNGKQKRDPRGHVKRDPPVSVNSSVHDLLPWRLFRGCSDLADGLTLAVHIVTCALRSHSRARRVRLSADAPGGVRNRPP